MALYGYIRVSTVEQVQGTSLEEQERKIRGLALMRGEEVAGIYSDAGVSGGIPLRQRPQGAELMAQVKAGDIIAVAKLDRIFRSAADGLTMMDEFKESGVGLVVLEIGTDPVTSNGISKMIASILSVVAEFEKSLIRDRISGGKAAKKAKGGFLGGKRPFGYQIIGQGKDSLLVEDEAEQKAIKRMKALRKKGLSLMAIADDLNSKGITISHMGVKKILDREAQQNLPT